MRVFFRVLRVLVPLVVVIALVAAAVSLFTARPDLENAKRTLERAWTPVAQRLGDHYELLTAADGKLHGLAGPVRELADDVRPAILRWQGAVQSRDVDAQVNAANELEALGHRLVATARNSKRARADAAATAAVEAYATDPAYAAATTVAAVDAFNRAVATYAEQRRGPVRGAVASLLGDHDIPAFASVPAPM